jgi:hypothetical protein
MAIRGDVLDLTDMQRRGILKKSEELKKSGVNYSGDGYVDFSHVDSSVDVKKEEGFSSGGETSGADLLSSVFGSSGSSSGTGSVSESSSAEGPDVVNPLGFMDSPAEKKVENPVSFWDQGTSSPESSVSTIGDSGLEIRDLKNKIEDLEFKIQVLEDKIARLG